LCPNRSHRNQFPQHREDRSLAAVLFCHYSNDRRVVELPLLKHSSHAFECVKLLLAGAAVCEVGLDTKLLVGRRLVVQIRHQSFVHIAVILCVHFFTTHFQLHFSYIASRRCSSRFLNSESPVYILVFTVESGMPSTSAISENFNPSYSFIMMTWRISNGSPCNARRTCRVICSR